MRYVIGVRKSQSAFVVIDAESIDDALNTAESMFLREEIPEENFTDDGFETYLESPTDENDM